MAAPACQISVSSFFQKGPNLLLFNPSGTGDVGGNVLATTTLSQQNVIKRKSNSRATRLYQEGVIQDDIVAILKSNSRLPGRIYGDLNGQISALELGVSRLDALLNDYGDDEIWLSWRNLKPVLAALMQSYVPTPFQAPYSARGLVR